MAEFVENIKPDSPSTDESVKKLGPADSDLADETQTPFMVTKARNSITQYSNCPPSPLLLERSVTEFERQVEVVYIAKMIPRPTSIHMDGSTTSSMGRSTLKKNETLNRSLPPSYGTAYVKPNSTNTCTRCCSAFRSLIDDGLHTFFYNYGKFVASHPWSAILFCILLTSVCGIGMLNFRMENVGIKLWIPRDSSQRINIDWLWANHPPDIRYSRMIFLSDNVLSPGVIQAMYRHKKSIDSIVTVYGDTWEKVCKKIPIVKAPDIFKIIFGGVSRRKRNSNETIDPYNDDDSPFDEYDPFGDDENDKVSQDDKIATAEQYSIQYYPKRYCDIVEDMEMACMEFSILELWAKNGKYEDDLEQTINSLTTEDILYKINNVNTSGVFLVERNFTELLSGIRRNGTGQIVSAEAAIVKWLAEMNTTDALLHPAKNRGEPISKYTMEFEGMMIEALLNQSQYPEGLKSYPNVHRSFGDIAGSTILGDLKGLVIGYMLLIAYVQIMLGRFNCVEQRALLTVTGIFGVIMGVIMSYGLCSAIGFFYGPMHSVLPFLLLGIGIDDMFVIVQCWDILDSKYKLSNKDGQSEESISIPERVGRTMSSAGGAITVTSLTDIVAFGIGGSTVLPALRSFCIYASVGILSIYFFQCTFFVAWMAIDQRRVAARRNACCPCYRHTDYNPNALSTKDYSKSLFNGYSKLLTKTPTKVFVVLVTAVITGLAIWGNLLLEQKFDPVWFLPPDTYLSNWVAATKKYFPFGGDRVTIYFSDIDPIGEYANLNKLALNIQNQTDIVDNVDSWTFRFNEYYNKYFTTEGEDDILPYKRLSTQEFAERFTQFLYSPRGSKYRVKFKFEGDLRCGKPAPNLVFSDIMFRHKIFYGPSEHIPAMNRIKNLIGEANLTGKVFPTSIFYPMWETDEIISKELYRNIGLALICVFVTTLILINNVVTSLIVMFCVVLSLVDVGGFMHFWGITIDTVSCVNLIIAIGLCVDYSAHIAHRFTEEKASSKNKRVRTALTNIGPAVLNGGISTFLAFVLLAGSKSHVFTVFFKIFFLVVTFGLFQGLVVLPVLLSILGPSSSYIGADTSNNDEHQVANSETINKRGTKSNSVSEKYTANESELKMSVLKECQ